MLPHTIQRHTSIICQSLLHSSCYGSVQHRRHAFLESRTQFKPVPAPRFFLWPSLPLSASWFFYRTIFHYMSWYQMWLQPFSTPYPLISNQLLLNFIVLFNLKCPSLPGDLATGCRLGGTRSMIRSSGIYGGQSGKGPSILRIFRFFL